MALLSRVRQTGAVYCDLVNTPDYGLFLRNMIAVYYLPHTSLGSTHRTGNSPMDTIRRAIAALRAFWANRQQRRTVMWVLGAVGVLVLAFGAYTYLDARNEINDIEARKDRFLAAFPTTEVDGEMRPDLRDASQADLLWLALQRRNQDKAEVRRSRGVMGVGLGLLTLGLAYLVAPTDERPASADPSAGDTSPTA